MEWYYVENGTQMGPVSDQEFRQLVDAGTVVADTLVWHAGLQNWEPYSNVTPPPAEPVQPGAGPSPVRISSPAAASVPQPQALPAQAVCVECGRSFPVDEMVRYETSMVCAECKPIFFQRVKEGAAMPGTLDVAGFWIRFAAKFVDGIILSGVNMVIGLFTGVVGAAAGSGHPGPVLAAQGVQALLQIAFGVFYTVFFLGKYAATPGKMACHLKVVRSDGSKISYARACGRYFAEFLSGCPTLFIGYLMVAFDEQNRALHDIICDTRVIRAG
ncbi:MAG: RDD family protein [Kiritimatiellae bacterium]|nr:RDD family protein [Kiritimatiellia bacterium]